MRSTAESSRSRDPNRVVLTLFVAGVIAIIARGLLLAFGRQTVLDGFYLHGAWRMSLGDVPYHDFVHVAFPIVETIYAAAMRLGSDLLLTASATTGVAVIATALLLADFVRREHGAAAGIVAAAFYATSAHLCAYHAFEREVWTNLGLAWCAHVALSRHGAGDRKLAMFGVAIAFTILCKLTAVIGVVALLFAAARREGLRAAVLPAAIAGSFVVAATALLFASHGAEFTTQVFAFFFWKGESASISTRLLEIARSAEPALAIGVLGACAVGLRSDAATTSRILLVAWLGYYAFLSPSFWDHNAIDFLLPASALAGVFLVDAIGGRAWGRLALALGVAIAATHAFEPRSSRWIGFPHGFGADVSRQLALDRGVLESHSREGDWVFAPNPLTAAIARRRPFVSDFELEPVARGLLREFRIRGVVDALARRRDAVVLGSPESRPLERQSGTASRFADRVNANTLVHLVPRWLDAITRREIAVILAGDLPDNFTKTLRDARYRKLMDPRAPGFVREP